MNVGWAPDFNIRNYYNRIYCRVTHHVPGTWSHFMALAHNNSWFEPQHDMPMHLVLCTWSVTVSSSRNLHDSRTIIRSSRTCIALKRALTDRFTHRAMIGQKCLSVEQFRIFNGHMINNISDLCQVHGCTLDCCNMCQAHFLSCEFANPMIHNISELCQVHGCTWNCCKMCQAHCTG